MSSTVLQVTTTVLPGNRIEICAPELRPGETATVTISVNQDKPAKRRFYDVINDYPGGQLFRSTDEVDAYLRAERDSWDR